MKIVAMKCPNCNADVNVDLENKTAFCQYCGQQLFVADETQHVEHDISEDAGYKFEKGRLRAQAEAQQQENVGGIRCPRCNSPKVTIKREHQGYASTGQSKRSSHRGDSSGSRQSNLVNYYRTVGICQNCGNTWTISQEKPIQPKKQMNPLLKICIWLFFFPFMLSYWFWKSDILKGKNAIKGAIIATCWILLFAISGSDSSSKKSEATSSETVAETIEESSELSTEEIKKNLEDKYSLKWSGEVNNDVTGKWRLSKYASSTTQEEIATDYYKAYFQDDSEIHALINTTNKTTARISKVDEHTLDVTIMEYLEGEENDAKILFRGDYLKQYFVNIDTGKVEDLDENENQVVDDETVNMFLSSYSAASDSPFTDLEKSSTGGKFFGYSHGYYCELSKSGNDSVRVAINQTNENADAGVVGMKDIFRDCSKAFGDSRTDEEIDAYFGNLISGGQTSNGIKNINYEFSPDVEGRSRGHITITGVVK